MITENTIYNLVDFNIPLKQKMYSELNYLFKIIDLQQHF